MFLAIPQRPAAIRQHHFRVCATSVDPAPGPPPRGIPRQRPGIRDSGSGASVLGRMSLITRPGRATNRPKNPKDNRTRFAANGICKSSSMAAFFKHFDFAFTAGNEQSAANAETKAPTQTPTQT